jgi:hypothetical protein
MHFLILQPDIDLNKKTTSRFMTAANPSVNVSGINYYTRYSLERNYFPALPVSFFTTKYHIRSPHPHPPTCHYVNDP